MLKVLVSVCVLVSAVLQAAPLKPDSKSPRQLYEQAAKAIASADTRAAIAPLAELIEDQPTSSLAAIAVVHLAECYVSVGRSDDAAAKLEEWSDRVAVESKSTKLDADLYAHHLRVWLLAAKRISDNATAVKSLEVLSKKLATREAADMKPETIEVSTSCRLELARRLAVLGKFEQAATQLNGLTQAANVSVNAEMQLLQAIVFQQVGNHTMARKALQSLLDTDGQTQSHAVARLELATYALQDRRLEDASNLLGPLVNAEPSSRGFDESLDCRFRLLWSELELAKGNAVRSLEVLPPDNELAKLDEPQQIAVRFCRAEAAAQAGKVTIANDDLHWLSEYAQKAVNAPSWAVTVALRESELLLKTKDYVKLVATIEESKRRFAKFERQHEFDYLLARAAMQQIEFDQARVHLRSIIESAVDKNTSAVTRAQWMLGETFFLEQNFKEAIAAYKPVTLQTASTSWQTLALMQTAKCFELLNQSSDALDAYRRVVTITGDAKIRQEAAERIEVIERTATRTKPPKLR